MRIRYLLFLALLLVSPFPAQSQSRDADGYSALTALFADWRQFENPSLRDGVPDYTEASMTARLAELPKWRHRLNAIETTGWPIADQVDWQLAQAEMNGFEFHARVLKPWVRDPAFYASVWTYQSDTPAHEGPTPHALVELWMFEFPLTDEAAKNLTADLATVPPLLKQARLNLTGNARDLWVSGIKTVSDQAEALADLKTKIDSASYPALTSAVEAALAATEDFVGWLEEQAPGKTGPSGLGKEQYSWYLRHVHLIPLDWDDEVALLKRELERAHRQLKMEEQRNQHLPPLVAIANEDEYRERVAKSVDDYLAFLSEHNVMPMKPYMHDAISRRTAAFVPEESRNFFWTAVHFAPTTLWTHFYHWWDIAEMQTNPHPSPIRRGPLLYNIFDSRSEGLSTAMEEMMLTAGLYDDNPRAREIVYIMLAQRAARGLASLYAQSNDFTMKEARDFHVRWTPRGWMREDLDLLGFEQQLYLRQPGYGTSYITGKFLIEQLLGEQARLKGDDFTLYGFFQDLDAIGVIPVSMIRWELTGEAFKP